MFVAHTYQGGRNWLTLMEDFLLLLSSALCLSHSGLTTCRVSCELGGCNGTGIRFPVSSIYSGNLILARNYRSLPHLSSQTPSSDAYHYFSAIVMDLGTLLLSFQAVLSFQAGTVWSLLVYVCPVYWDTTESHSFYGILLSSCVSHTVIRAKISLMS